jgi:hypothetical protein
VGNIKEPALPAETEKQDTAAAEEKKDEAKVDDTADETEAVEEVKEDTNAEDEWGTEADGAKDTGKTEEKKVDDEWDWE